MKLSETIRETVANNHDKRTDMNFIYDDIFTGIITIVTNEGQDDQTLHQFDEEVVKDLIKFFKTVNRMREAEQLMELDEF